MRRMLIGLLIVGGIPTLIAGCGESGSEQPDTVSVSGTVTLDGKPLVGAEVTFASKEFSSTGKTGPDGKYTLVQGAVTGENMVIISKFDGEGIEMDPDEGMDEGQLEAAGMDLDEIDAPKQLVPADYSDPEKSKLKFNVPEGGTTSANFTLTSN